jgi:hypothetical protein
MRIDMAFRHSARTVLGCALTTFCIAAGTAAVMGQEAALTPLALDTARITIEGTSNVHAYTASTTTARLTRVQLAAGVAGPDFWASVTRPGGLEAFEIAIPAATLTSPKSGLDKNMHKALNVKEHADITFRLLRLEPGTGAPGALRAVGVLRIAGVEREIALDLVIERLDATLSITGEAQLLMTDFGIKPPKAMLGMLKTDPKVTVRFETVLATPLT